jgi:hypothetical protein
MVFILCRLSLLLLFLPFWANACSVTFQGDEFLAMSANKGIALESSCYEINLAENTFYAPHNKGCFVKFNSAKWLRSGWEFENIQGKGGFTISSQGSVILVNLDKKSGFVLKSLKVSSVLDNCDNIKLNDVL